MNVLFLGGNRYFGRSVLLELLKKKHRIFVVNRNTKNKNIYHKNLINITCDRNQLYNFKKFFKDVVFDCVIDNIAYKLKDVKDLHKLLKGKIKHYIFTSSIITYLNVSDNYDAKEKDWNKGKAPKNWIKDKNFKDVDIEYAINKKKIENYLITKKKIKYTILRIPNVIGKNDFSGKTQRLLEYPFEKNLHTQQIKENDFIQFILKDDLVKIILKIVNQKKKKSQIFNVGNKKILIGKFYVLLKKFSIKRYNPTNNNIEFPMPVNSLMNCSKVKKNLNFKFSSIDKILGLISKVSYR